jgi:pilus assembly protein Flp/PilA
MVTFGQCNCDLQREEFMKAFTLNLRRFLASEDGPTAVEYAVMLALIVVVCLTAIQSIGTNANSTFSNVATMLGS